MKTKKTEVIDRVIRKKIKGEDGHTYEVEMYDDNFTKEGEERVKKVIIDKETLEKIKAMASINLSKKYIAHVLGIEQSVFKRICEIHEQVNIAYKTGLATGVSNVAMKAYEMARSGKSPQMTISFLERVGLIEKEPRHYGIIESSEGGSSFKKLHHMNFEERLSKFQENTELIKKIELIERGDEIVEKEKKLIKYWM